MEHAIVSNYKNEAFAEDGDSGAWVLDRNGYLSGLIWGSNDLGHCYVTPISLIIEDIQQFMGETLDVL